MGNENVRSRFRKGILFFLLLSAVFLALGGAAHEAHAAWRETVRKIV